MSKSILINCTKEGTVTIEAVGYTGGSCIEATKASRDALLSYDGTSREFKPEYHHTVAPKRVTERQ